MTPVERLREIRRALERHDGERVELVEEHARAAVAMIFEARVDDVHVLLIRRASNANDPWSGHMGFPGGFVEAEDRNPMAAAVREVREELAVDLEGCAESIGQLDEIQGMARGRPLPLVITPFVFELRTSVAPKPNEEVAEFVWIPLGHLTEPSNETIVEYPRDGVKTRLPAVDFEGRTIWGLTYRMLRSFFEALPSSGRAQGPTG